jgi:lysozyme
MRYLVITCLSLSSLALAKPRPQRMTNLHPLQTFPQQLNEEIREVLASGIARDTIKMFEGCKLKSYKDQAGIWTLGYGETGPHIGPGLTITEAEAENWLNNRLQWTSQEINTLVKVPLSQNQFDALVSLVYNIGVGAFQHSTLLKYINTDHLDKAADEFLKWDHVGGVEDLGLLRRRKEERFLFKRP